MKTFQKSELGYYQITLQSGTVWLLKTAEWRTGTLMFPVQLRWASATVGYQMTDGLRAVRTSRCFGTLL